MSDDETTLRSTVDRLPAARKEAASGVGAALKMLHAEMLSAPLPENMIALLTQIDQAVRRRSGD
jgi:hypothetical protein